MLHSLHNFDIYNQLFFTDAFDVTYTGFFVLYKSYLKVTLTLLTASPAAAPKTLPTTSPTFALPNLAPTVFPAAVIIAVVTYPNDLKIGEQLTLIPFVTSTGVQSELAYVDIERESAKTGVPEVTEYSITSPSTVNSLVSYLKSQYVFLLLNLDN